MAGAAGTVSLTVRARGSYPMIIQQVGLSMSPARSGARGAITLNGSPITPFAATGDATAGDPPIWVRPGDEMSIDWTGCTVGDICKATVIYVLGPAGA